jgi:hypothetical protein
MGAALQADDAIQPPTMPRQRRFLPPVKALV